MAKGIKYTQEFKQDAVSQVTKRGYEVTDVASRLGICSKTLYRWIKSQQQSKSKKVDPSTSKEVRKLKLELARVTEERDILKKATAYFAKELI